MRLLIPLFFFAFAALSSKASVTETVESTHEVSESAAFSLENINGHVSIDTWDRAEIRVVALKKASTQEDLDAMKIRIHAEPDHVSVKTEYDRKDGSFFGKWSNSGEVAYTVTVPTGTTLREVRTVNGAVRVSGVAGPVNVSSVNGSVEVDGLRSDARIGTVNGHVTAGFAAITDDQKIHINSVNGRSEIVLPADANCGIEARTVHGSIRNDFGLEVAKTHGAGNRLNARIGEGGASVDISTVNGGIRVTKAKGTL